MSVPRGSPHGRTRRRGRADLARHDAAVERLVDAAIERMRQLGERKARARENAVKGMFDREPT